MDNKTKYIFISKQRYPHIEKCEDVYLVYKQRAEEFFKKVVARCPNAVYITNTLGRLVFIAMPEDELDALSLAEEFNCSIYKQIAGQTYIKY